MDKLAETVNWLVGEGRFLRDNRELLERFCDRVVATGIPLTRAWLHNRALHPQYKGVTRVWKRGETLVERYLDHGFEKTPAYLNSPVRFVVEHGKIFRSRLDTEDALPFPVLGELRQAGYVDYVIAPILFSAEAANALSWATDRPGGFSEDDLKFFSAIVPSYAAIVEAKSLRRFASNMLTTYVGREPGELILKGQIRRGEVRTITAALMLVDLRGFTGLSDTLAPSAVIDTLNRYFDCVIPPVKAHGGEVMKIMGDGILAIFNEGPDRGPAEVCRQALAAATEGLAALQRSNGGDGAKVLELNAGFALHHGTASYGNIGTEDRLDFTVIGPDVNLTSRIERLCRELDQKLIMSQEFADRLDTPMFEIGHFALRGFSRMQLLFGLPIPPSAG